MDLAGSILMLIGSIFFFISALGLVRMPDIYNRIQTGTKATTLGTILMLSGVGLCNPLWWPKLFVVLVSVLLTNPISSHVIARAAHFKGEHKTELTVTDDLNDPDDKEV